MSALGGNVARAAQYAINGVAMEARSRQRQELESELDHPTPWTKSALIVRAGKLSVERLADVSASVAVKDNQSIVLKHLFGDGPQQREPGDVGLSEEHVLTPVWSQLLQHTTIKKTAAGNLPKTALQRLISGTATRQQRVWFGQPFGGGPLGIWMRQAKGSTSRIALLLRAYPKVEYQPILQRPFEEAAELAMRSLPGRLEGALKDRLKYLGKPVPRSSVGDDVPDFLRG